MEQILLAYSLSKETTTDIIILHKNTKAKVYSLDGDTDFLGIVTKVLQRDTMSKTLIFHKIVPMTFNTLIPMGWSVKLCHCIFQYSPCILNLL